MQPDAPAAPGPSAQMGDRSPLRRRVLFALLVAVILGAAVGLVPLAVGTPWALMAHYQCGMGATIAKETLWTPLVLVNSPYGGFGNGTGRYPTASGWSSTNFTEANGMAAAVFEQEEWSIGPLVRVLVAGPGANANCAGFVAAARELGNYTGAAALLPAGSKSDRGENVSFSAYGYASVVFNANYSENEFSVGTCGGGQVVMSAHASHITVQIPFNLGGSDETAWATIDGAFNYSYTFPGNFGTWFVDDLTTGSHAPGGGWAFSYLPCP